MHQPQSGHQRDEPKAEAALASGLGSRPSLGYPGDKYEMGLEGVEKVEVIAAELAAEILAPYAEIRVPSGAIANLYAFMVGGKGRRLHHRATAINRRPCHPSFPAVRQYGIETHAPPSIRRGYTVDVDGLRTLARQVKPKMITIGSSLNLLPHPIREIRAIADEVGALYSLMQPICAE